MRDNKPVIVLVRPQLGQNIGKAARAMLNFGLTDLRLVSPRDGWPNPDAGTDEMAGSLRHMREEHSELTRQIRFITNVPVDEFVSLLKQTACLVGNSSAGIKECSFLGTPVVNIGARQQGRTASPHAVNVAYQRDEIAQAIARQLAHGRYPVSTIYHQPDTSDQILNILASAQLYTQKRFIDPPNA